eukprot:523712-Prorocentrum_minimum.AAC.1
MFAGARRAAGPGGGGAVPRLPSGVRRGGADRGGVQLFGEAVQRGGVRGAGATACGGGGDGARGPRQDHPPRLPSQG